MGIYPFKDGYQDQLFYGSSAAMAKVTESLWKEVQGDEICHTGYDDPLSPASNNYVYIEKAFLRSVKKVYLECIFFECAWGLARCRSQSQIVQTIYGLYFQLKGKFKKKKRNAVEYERDTRKRDRDA